MLNRVVVRGVSFRGPETLRVAAAFAAGEEVPARLIIIDDNPHDRNAVKIEAAMNRSALHIGWLASELCKQFRSLATDTKTYGRVIEAEPAESGKYAGIAIEFELDGQLNQQCAVGRQPRIEGSREGDEL